MSDALLPRTLRAVVFDVDGTLYQQGPLRRTMALRLLRAHLHRPLLGVSTLRILSAYRRGQEALRDEPGGGDLGEAQVRYACRETGASPDAVKAVVTQWMEQAPLDRLDRFARPGMQAFVRELRSTGIKLGVLSDYPAEAKLAALGVGGLFHSVLCAQAPDVGVFKPNPRGILVSLERLGVTASDALYVGDRAEVDAAAARAAGVACAILSHRTPAPDAGFFSVASFADLSHLLVRHSAISTEPRGAAPQ